MPERIIEIAHDGRHLAMSRGFMTVQEKGEEIGRVPLDDIAAVIANAHGITYTNNLLVELSKRGAIMVFCGANHAPVSFLWSVDSHHVQSGRIEAQIQCTQPKAKQIWKQVVQSKITQQANVLESLNKPSTPLKALVKKVRSGDPDNIEAQAARRYWTLLFGDDFRRDRQSQGTNAMLNYGYTILRATVARYIMASGLHPSIGVHHSNRLNPMRLVDDMMEPFRPFVDSAVFHLLTKGCDNVDKETKAFLASVMEIEVPAAKGLTPLRLAIQAMIISLAQIYEGKSDSLELPDFPMPLEYVSWQV